MNKESCEHTSIKVEEHVKEFQKEKFSYNSQTCQECGAILWNSKTETQYNNWLNSLHSSKRHLFQVQFSLSETALQCIENINARYPGVDESLLIRAIVIVYLDIIDGIEDVANKIEAYTDTTDFHHLTNGAKRPKKIQFKPNGMRDLLAYANLLELKASKVIEESIYRVLLLSIKEDDEMKEFWNKVILKNIETILKAA